MAHKEYGIVKFSGYFLILRVSKNPKQYFFFKQMTDHHSSLLNLSSWENKAWKKKKKSGLNGNGTHDLCDTAAAL